MVWSDVVEGWWTSAVAGDAPSPSSKSIVWPAASKARGSRPQALWMLSHAQLYGGFFSIKYEKYRILDFNLILTF